MPPKKCLLSSFETTKAQKERLCVKQTALNVNVEPNISCLFGREYFTLSAVHQGYIIEAV